MKSLAEYLGVSLEPGPPAAEAPELDPERFSARDFARMVLSSYEYRRSVLQRVLCGELSPQIEVLLFHYAAGKPVERIEMKDTTDVANMSKAELEAEAAFLLELARDLPEADSQQPTPSVH